MATRSPRSPSSPISPHSPPRPVRSPKLPNSPRSKSLQDKRILCLSLSSVRTTLLTLGTFAFLWSVTNMITILTYNDKAMGMFAPSLDMEEAQMSEFLMRGGASSGSVKKKKTTTAAKRQTGGGVVLYFRIPLPGADPMPMSSSTEKYQGPYTKDDILASIQQHCSHQHNPSRKTLFLDLPPQTISNADTAVATFSTLQQELPQLRSQCQANQVPFFAFTILPEPTWLTLRSFYQTCTVQKHCQSNDATLDTILPHAVRNPLCQVMTQGWPQQAYQTVQTSENHVGPTALECDAVAQHLKTTLDAVRTVEDGVAWDHVLGDILQHHHVLLNSYTVDKKADADFKEEAFLKWKKSTSVKKADLEEVVALDSKLYQEFVNWNADGTMSKVRKG